MSWNYQQSTGILKSPVGSSWQGATWIGYSGRDDGRNNPDMQDVHNIGPIPQGSYTIGPAYEDPEKGPIVMHLTPSPDNEMFGRSGFLMHGNNPENDASEGCIIMSPNVRKIVNASEDKMLQVIA